MDTLYALAVVVHLGFAGLWAGAVVFVTWGVLPPAERGDLTPEPLAALTEKLSTLSRASSGLLLVTGAYMAYALGGNAFSGTTTGIIVGLMVLCWLALTGLVEMGCARLRDGTDLEKVRTPAQEAKPRLQAATAFALILLVLGGLLAAGY